MNRIPCSAQNSASPERNPGAGTMNPPSPWIGSTMTAAMLSSPMCLCISSRAYASASAAQRSGPVGQRYGYANGSRYTSGANGPMPCL